MQEHQFSRQGYSFGLTATMFAAGDMHVMTHKINCVCCLDKSEIMSPGGITRDWSVFRDISY